MRISDGVQTCALPIYSDDIFASIDSARFAVAIWPLFSNRLVVDHVAVTGFKAWVRRDKNGQFNFHDLLENKTSAQSGSRIALANGGRSEEHTSELQSLMRISYAVFCLKKKTKAQ